MKQTDFNEEPNKQFLSGYTLYKTVLNPKISKSQYSELYKFAIENDIYLSDFKDYTGNINSVIEMIKKIVNVRKDFPKLNNGRKKPTLRLYFSDSEEFAYTENREISVNGFWMNDAEWQSTQYLKLVEEGYFVSGTTVDDIIYHELGHLVCNVYKLVPLQIAYDILGFTDNTKIVTFLMNNLSIYSASREQSVLFTDRKFDGSEIISECFCAYYSGSNNEFAKNYVEKCKEIVLERRC